MLSTSLQFPAWRKPEPKLIVPWAEENVRVTASERAGQLRLFPYQAEILAAMADPAITEVDLMISSQSGKTLLLAILLGWLIDQYPCQVIFMHATQKGLKKFNREKLNPLLKANPDINAKVHRNQQANIPVDGFTYDGGFVTLASERAVSDEHGTTAEFVIADEIDDYQDGEAAQNLSQRGITFEGKAVLSSTPSEKNASAIQRRYDLGSQGWLYIPCPHCGAEHTFDDEYFVDAALWCPSCAGRIGTAERDLAVRSGRFIEQEPNPTHKSFWLPQHFSLLVPLERTWVSKQEYGERIYSTQVKARPYEEVRLKPVSVDRILRKEREWPVYYRCVGVDLQGDRIEWALVDFDRLLELKHIAAWGTILRQEGYGHWHELRANVTGWNWLSVDGGFEFDHVQQGLWDAYPDRYLLEEPQIEIVRGYTGDSFDKPVRGGRGAGGYRWIATDEVKRMISTDLTNGLLTLDPTLNEIAEQQMASEKMVRTLTTTGKVERRWVKVSPKERNELLDDTGYAYSGAVAATAHALHIVPDSWELSDHYLYSDEHGDYHRCYRFENGNAPALACWPVDQPTIIPLP